MHKVLISTCIILTVIATKKEEKRLAFKLVINKMKLFVAASSLFTEPMDVCSLQSLRHNNVNNQSGS